MKLINDLDNQAPIDEEVGRAIMSLWEGEAGRRLETEKEGHRNSGID